MSRPRRLFRTVPELPPVIPTCHRYPESTPPAGIYCRLRDDMKLSRRKLMTRASAAPGMLLSAVAAQEASAAGCAPGEFPTVSGLTREVAEFIVSTRYSSIPEDVAELGRKSILDGLGLALCGSVAESGNLSREYVKSLGISRGDATVIGSPMKVPARFAAFVNGIGI